MTEDEEFAELAAYVEIAAVQARLKASPVTGDSLLESLDELFRQQNWQVTAARNLQINLWSKIVRPFSYRLRDRLLEKLSNSQLSPAEERDVIERLCRCASLLEFNVEVNSYWYRRLKEVVADRKISKAHLRSLLRSSTVWWGTHSAPPIARHTRGFFRFFELLNKGRPRNGDLFLIDFHWTTKVALIIVLGLACVVFSAILWGLGLGLFYKGTKLELAFLIFAATQVGTFVCSTWFIGPRSWRAKTQLESIFPELRRIA